MQNQPYTVGQWNAGTNINDYLYHYDKLSPDEPISEEIQNQYNTVSKLAPQTLAKTAHVFTLQEVPSNDREDIQALINNNFQIIRPNNKEFTDTAIAIDLQKFKDIENRSFTPKQGESCAIAVATEKSSGKKIAFVSAHISGFNLEMPKEMMKSAAESDDNHLKKLLQHINQECSDCHTVIIGADVNASPEIYRDRFDIFKQEGFKTHRTNSPTQRMPANKTKLTHRELDYFFVRTNKQEENKFIHFLKNLFSKDKVQIEKIDLEKKPLELDPKSTPSDHIPIFLSVQEKSNPGFFPNFINKLVNSVKNTLKLFKQNKELDSLKKEVKKYDYTAQNNLQEGAVHTGFIKEKDRKSFTHTEETIETIKDINQRLQSFKKNNFGDDTKDNLSNAQEKMLKEIISLEKILKTEMSSAGK